MASMDTTSASADLMVRGCGVKQQADPSAPPSVGQGQGDNYYLGKGGSLAASQSVGPPPPLALASATVVSNGVHSTAPAGQDTPHCNGVHAALAAAAKLPARSHRHSPPSGTDSSRLPSASGPSFAALGATNASAAPCASVGPAAASPALPAAATDAGRSVAALSVDLAHSLDLSPSANVAAAAAAAPSASDPSDQPVCYVVYESELQMNDIMRLIQKDLSEPYSIYTYRYFIHNWPHLCFMARVQDECVGAVVCKLDYHKKVVKRGYIAMLAVDSRFRKRQIGSTLVRKAIDAMIAQEADEIVLETEITNKSALGLYEKLGFVRDKRLFRYYLNGVDALRLKLWLR